MKKILILPIVVSVCFCPVLGNDLFQMKIANQAVAQAIDTVCLIYIDEKIGKPVYGGPNRSIIRRLLKVGETIWINKFGSPEKLSDNTRIYSEKWSPDLDWNRKKIDEWNENLKKLNQKRRMARKLNGPRNSEINGFVLSSDTLAPICANISFFDLENNLIGSVKSDSLSGFYRYGIPPGVYAYEVKAQDFLISVGEISIAEGEVFEFEIKLPRMKIDNRVILRNVYFEFGKSTLKQESFLGLDALEKFLREYPGVQIEISGHTDNIGSFAYNQKLSEERARSVVNYLVAKGIEQKRLLFRGAGFTEPIAPNTLKDGSDNPDGRQKNRRTEFKILKI